MSTNQSDGGYKMTPEQQANLKNFGKKNGLSEQKVHSQLAQEKIVQQPISQPQVVSKVPPRVASSATIQTIPAPSLQTNGQLGEFVNKQCETYYAFVDENGGNLEVDLITFREKGIETRYLSMLFSGQDVRQNPPVAQEAFLNIESREDFERLKSFFAQLEWEG